ncbi:hypothetical protein [Methanococcoides sp. AM1]|uniref:hypothetical protein n=1 Tax=Methanococcoides sp. AM1 TaxID=1201011 RepID=UPI0014384493|nr:hypothetical protein [Methanococcoides sp. AM1]
MGKIEIISVIRHQIMNLKKDPTVWSGSFIQTEHINKSMKACCCGIKLELKKKDDA